MIDAAMHVFIAMTVKVIIDSIIIRENGAFGQHLFFDDAHDRGFLNIGSGESQHSAQTVLCDALCDSEYRNLLLVAYNLPTVTAFALYAVIHFIILICHLILIILFVYM